MEQRSRELDRRKRETAAQIESLKAQLASEEAEAAALNQESATREDQLIAGRTAMSDSRSSSRGDVTPFKPTSKMNG
jgi:circadian clock protein KaiC